MKIKRTKFICSNCGFANIFDGEIGLDADCRKCGEGLSIMDTDKTTVNDDMNYKDLQDYLENMDDGYDVLNPTPQYYNYIYRGIKLDPYRIIEIYGITHPAQQQALKKILRMGTHDKRELHEDILGVIDALRRWLEMIEEEERVKNAWNSLKE